MLGQPWMKRRGIRVETVPGVEVSCYFGQLGIALPTISNLEEVVRLDKVSFLH